MAWFTRTGELHTGGDCTPNEDPQQRTGGHFGHFAAGGADAAQQQAKIQTIARYLAEFRWATWP